MTSMSKKYIKRAWARFTNLYTKRRTDSFESTVAPRHPGPDPFRTRLIDQPGGGGGDDDDDDIDTIHTNPDETGDSDSWTLVSRTTSRIGPAPVASSTIEVGKSSGGDKNKAEDYSEPDPIPFDPQANIFNARHQNPVRCVHKLRTAASINYTPTRPASDAELLALLEAGRNGQLDAEQSEILAFLRQAVTNRWTRASMPLPPLPKTTGSCPEAPRGEPQVQSKCEHLV